MSPRRSKLSRKEILDTALAIVDEKGLDELSMRNLAGRLNVQAMSLYNHIKNKEELLYGIVEIVVCEVELSQPSDDWKEDLRQAAMAFRKVLLRHPNVIPILSAHSPLTDKGREQTEKLISILKVLDMSDFEAYSFMHIMISYIIGHAGMSVTNLTDLKTREIDYLHQTKRYPQAVEIEFVQRNMDEEFLSGFNLMLDGLAQRKEI